MSNPGIPLASVLIALAASGCADEDALAKVPADEIQSVWHLNTGLPLPASASNVWNFENKFLDAIQLLRFDASVTDARRFARAVLHKDPVPGQPPLFMMGDRRRSWWIQRYPAGGEGGRFEEVARATTSLILLPVGDRARVWVVSFDTCSRPHACLSWRSTSRR